MVKSDKRFGGLSGLKAVFGRKTFGFCGVEKLFWKTLLPLAMMTWKTLNNEGRGRLKID